MKIKLNPIATNEVSDAERVESKTIKECFMWDECKYELSAPCDWDLPDGEKGSEE